MTLLGNRTTKKMAVRLRRTWRKLTEPSSHISNPIERIQVWALTIIILVGISSASVFFVVLWLALGWHPATWMMAGSLIALVVIYILSRSQYHRISIWLSIIAGYTVALGWIIYDPTPLHTIILIIPFTITSFFLNRWPTIILSLLSIGLASLGIRAYPQYHEEWTLTAVLLVSLVGLLIVIQAIRRRGYSKMNELVSLLQATIESTQDGFIIFDRKQNIILCNSRFRDIWGLPNDWEQTIPADERFERLSQKTEDPEVFLAYVGSLDQNPETRKTIESRLKDGRVIECSNYPYYINNRLAGRLCLHKDITETVLAANALRESEQRYRLLADNALDVIWTMDLEGNFTYVSPSVKQLRGYAPEEVLEQPITEALTPASLIVATEALQRLVEQYHKNGAIEEYQTRFELEQPRKDGTTVWTEVNTNLLYDENSRPVGIMGVSRDISERRYLESQRLDLAVERERVGLLQKFIGDIYHDFVTPLTVLKTSSYLIRRSGLTTKQAEHLETMDTQVIYLESIISDMLTMSKLDRLLIDDFDFQEQDINELSYKVVEDLRPAAQRKQQPLEFKRETISSMVPLDAPKMKGAFAHILGNAIQYTPEGGSITVSTGIQEDMVYFRVEDSGEGIDATELPNIFDRFYRGKAHRPNEGSVGLGLSIARRIVEAHQGHIHTESQKGIGSTFTIYLPKQQTYNNNSRSPVDDTTGPQRQ